jgi:hypothetical protein
MKKLPLTLLLLLAFVPADAQVDRGGGIFGFGRKKEQINSGLFPDSAPTAPVNASYKTNAPATSAPPQPSAMPAPNGENIFRSIVPQKVESASFVIKNGQKVEQGTEKKKTKLFGFGKKKKLNKTAETNVLKTIPTQPAPVSPDQNGPAPTTDYTPTAPVVVEEAVADTNETRADTTDIPSEARANIKEEPKKKKSKMFGFFSRKNVKIPDPAPTFQTPVVADTPAADATPVVTAPEVVDSPVPAPALTPPAPQPVATESTPATAAPHPNFAGVNIPKKEKSGFAIPNPMKNLKMPTIKVPANPIKAIRPPRKEKTIDLTGAETIIANGEIIEGQGDIVETNRVSTQSGPRQAPQVINGVTTYSSWDDVGGRSVSAADKILSQIR